MRVTPQEHDALQELDSADLSAAGLLRKLFINLVVIANEKLEEPATTDVGILGQLCHQFKRFVVMVNVRRGRVRLCSG